MQSQDWKMPAPAVRRLDLTVISFCNIAVMQMLFPPQSSHRTLATAGLQVQILPCRPWHHLDVSLANIAALLPILLYLGTQPRPNNPNRQTLDTLPSLARPGPPV